MNKSPSQAVTFGISLGIGHCGWAVLRRPTAGGPTDAIVALGSWMFDVPETDQYRTPTNQIRRTRRVQRRALRRRAQRASAVRDLFFDHGLIATKQRGALASPGLDPWHLRSCGLDTLLTPLELAVALSHIAKRRGFRSTSKAKELTSGDDSQTMLRAINATKEVLGQYRTVGEMAENDPDWQKRKRNREGVFDRTQTRDDMLHEVHTLFEAQRKLGCRVATEALEDAYILIAFAQRSQSEHLQNAGWCRFENEETRAAKHAPSFEKLRLLARLVALRVVSKGEERPLSQSEIEKITDDLGKSAKISARSIRKCIGLNDDQFFSSINRNAESFDIVARGGEAMHGTKRLRMALGEKLWHAMYGRQDQLDAIANALTFYETRDAIVRQLEALGLASEAASALREALDNGAFARFRGAGHISAKACRVLIPMLETGIRYPEACQEVGYDNVPSRWNEHGQVTDKAAFNLLVQRVLSEVFNPIARKVLVEGLKQIWAMCNRWGIPDGVHIELAQDVGISLEQRRTIEWAFSRRVKQREQDRIEAAELLSLSPIELSLDSVLRYRLWKQQNGRCPFTDCAIPITSILASDIGFQVVHILPWSRFGDDSFHNKVFCKTSVAKQKRSCTPHEWIVRKKGEGSWAAFVDRVETNDRYSGNKKRNFLTNINLDGSRYIRNHNIINNKFAGRLLTEAVLSFYPFTGRPTLCEERMAVCRPSALMAALRHAWGLESIKFVDGERSIDARQHALDALAVAAASDAEIQRLTEVFAACEQQGLPYSLRAANPPWGDLVSFRREAQEAYERIFVARPERRRARGEGHAATVRQVRDGKELSVVYERKSVADLKEVDLERVKDRERNKPLVEAIQHWMTKGRPLDDWPCSPAGDPVHKVRLRTNGKPSVRLRGGTVDRGELVRVDIFKKLNNRNKVQFFVVPIYPHQVADKRSWPRPPSKAVSAFVDEEYWIEIDANFDFCFSLHPQSFIEIEKRNGKVLSGYFNGVDRSTGAISLKSDRNSRDFLRGLGLKNLQQIRKFNVDRFGCKSEVNSERRTWHGAICTMI